MPHGGVEHVAWEVAHGLSRAGDEVHVFCREAGQTTGSDTAGGPSVHPRVHVLGGPRGWQPLRVRAFSRAAGSATRAHGLDLVQSFSRTRHQDVYRAGGGCHQSYMERAYGPIGARLRRLSPRHATLLAMEARIFADPAQTILCNSRMVEREIRARYDVPPERLRVIPNGVDLARFDPAKRHAEAGAEGPLWLFAGHGFARKGLDTALRALAASKSDGRLHVAGGDDPAPFRALAARLDVSERVRFLGARDDLERLLATADALLLPTRYDAFANVCLEAAAAAVPVVTSAANGAAEFLEGAALVVDDPEDHAAFALALDQLADRTRAREMGARGRALAETTSWDHHVAALRALYRERLA